MCQIAAAQSNDERDMLLLFYPKGNLFVSATRYEKPISQVAENVTVISAEDIEAMNAHTLADVLNHIPGVQMDIKGGPGNGGIAYIQGSDDRHVLVLIDGVALNNLTDNIVDVAAITVQHVERIEIIKGPASSAWGSSLGGVINVITKSAGDPSGPEGAAAASYGEKDTGDYRAEVSGRAGRMGYYLSAGRLQSDGFAPGMSVFNDNVYTKLDMDMGNNASIVLSTGYNKGIRGLGEYAAWDMSFDDEFENAFSTLSLNTRFNGNSDLTLSLRRSKLDRINRYNSISAGTVLQEYISKEESVGGSIKLTSHNERHTFAVGADYDNGESVSSTIASGVKRLEKWAVFANDTITHGDLSITPGLRYDRISTSNDSVSPSLGATYVLGKNSIFRAGAAKGFNSPPLGFTYPAVAGYNPNPGLKAEKVWSYQAGVETAALRYLWVKTTAFRHDVSDEIASELQPDGTVTKVNMNKTKRYGLEVEVETAPVYNLAFKGGYAYQEVRDSNADKKVMDKPQYTVDVGLEYDDMDSVRGLLAGHYIWWYAAPQLEGKYSSFIWDLSLGKRLLKTNNMTGEVFLTAHNLFNNSQYLMELYQNPGRWVEVGIRYRF
jgi:vitamin B12 transporter